jgi:hypothetical protein
MVMMRALVKATAPAGRSRSSVSPMGTPLAAGSGSSSGAPSRNAKASRSSRVKYSGPIVQCSRCESPDQWRYMAGVAGDAGDRQAAHVAASAIGPPASGIGAT